MSLLIPSQPLSSDLWKWQLLPPSLLFLAPGRERAAEDSEGLAVPSTLQVLFQASPFLLPCPALPPTPPLARTHALFAHCASKRI